MGTTASSTINNEDEECSAGRYRYRDTANVLAECRDGEWSVVGRPLELCYITIHIGRSSDLPGSARGLGTVGSASSARESNTTTRADQPTNRRIEGRRRNLEVGGSLRREGSCTLAFAEVSRQISQT